MYCMDAHIHVYTCNYMTLIGVMSCMQEQVHPNQGCVTNLFAVDSLSLFGYHTVSPTHSVTLLNFWSLGNSKQIHVHVYTYMYTWHITLMHVISCMSCHAHSCTKMYTHVHTCTCMHVYGEISCIIVLFMCYICVYIHVYTL